MKEELRTVEYVSMLYDFYGALLNDSQNEVMSLYHEDNLSLSEIAEQLGMTRQAVHYILKKAERALDKYEDKLGLLAAYHENQETAGQAIKLAKKDKLTGDEREELIRLIVRIAE